MKKHFLALAIVLWTIPFLQAQTCSCSFGQTLQPAGYYSGYEFNCYQYVRAVFAGGHYGTWVPPQVNNIGSFPSNVISEANDPGIFQLVTNPTDANVVVYDCGHAAVIVGGECLVEKVGHGSELRKFGLNFGSCLVNCSTTKFFRYIGSYWPYRGIDLKRCDITWPCTPPQEPTCNRQVVWYGTTTVLNTFNYTSNYFNQIWVDCQAADNITWQKISGSDVYSSCFSSCRGFYFYLNVGQSVTYRVTAKQGGTTLFTKDYTFYRTSGSGWAMETDAPYPVEEPLRFMQNKVASQSPYDLRIEVFAITGQRMQTFQLGAFATEHIQAPQKGIYIVSATNSAGERVTYKVYLHH